MSKGAALCSVVTAGLLAVMMPSAVSAQDAYNGIGGTYYRRVYLTFSGPVQVPNATLSAGTYEFLLPDLAHVIQVRSKDGKKVYSMFDTIPAQRGFEGWLSSNPTVTFREAPPGVPPPIKTLYDSMRTWGYEFIYPKGGPNLTAEIPPQPEITYTKHAPAAVETETVARAETAPVEAPAAVTPAPEEPAPVATTGELPRTASSLPWLAVGGLISLISGFGVSLARRRLS